MLPDPALLDASVAAVLVIAATPGPGMAFLLGRAITQGSAAGMAALGGAMARDVVQPALAAPQASLALTDAGAASLPWLAWQALRQRAALRLPARSARRGLARTWAIELGINHSIPGSCSSSSSSCRSSSAPRPPPCAGATPAARRRPHPHGVRGHGARAACSRAGGGAAVQLAPHRAGDRLGLRLSFHRLRRADPPRSRPPSRGLTPAPEAHGPGAR